MAIRAFMREGPPERIDDMLGGDPIRRGEPRSGVYPSVEVVYYDDTLGDHTVEAAHKGIACYVLRPRSALASLEDVEYRVGREIARLTTESRPAPPRPVERPAPLPPEVTARLNTEITLRRP